MSLSKYHSVRVEYDGHVFDSKLESNRYIDLMLLQRAGEIKDLEMQVKYDLIVNGMKIAAYIADFRYVDCATGATIVEDTKGFRTRDYKIKAKLMQAIHGITIQEVGGSR